MNSDDSRSNSPQFGSRRPSLTERVLGNAREWFQNNRSVSNSGVQLGSSPPTDDGMGRGRSKSLSNSYMFNHHRDLIIPGPVF